MDYIHEKAEGLGIEESTKEGKLLLHIIDALGDFADGLDELNERHDDLDEYVSYMDEDLADVEEEVFGDLDDEDYDEDYDEDEDYDDLDYAEIECPNCHEIVYLDKELLSDEEEAECPNCHKKLNTKHD